MYRILRFLHGPADIRNLLPYKRPSIRSSNVIP